MSTTITRPELARRSDPSTSHDAASKLNGADLSKQKAAILELLAEEPRDDHALTVAYFNLADKRDWPITDPDSIRKRRAQLKNAGKVQAAGTTVGHTGREVTVWAVAS